MWAFYFALCLMTAIACGRRGSNQDRDGSSGDEDPRLERPTCLGQGHEERGVDVDGDGDADIVDAFVEGVRVCSAMDLNFDGKLDLQRFYADDGETTRLELHDFDFDGRLDGVSLFEDGARVRAEFDTDFDSAMDLFLFCEGGQPTRVKRKRLRRDRVDTWESYENGLLTEARYDEDGDGEVDRIETYRDGRLHIESVDRNQDGEFSEEERSTIEDEFVGSPQRLGCDLAAIATAARAAAPSSADDSSDASSASDASDPNDASEPADSNEESP